MVRRYRFYRGDENNNVSKPADCPSRDSRENTAKAAGMKSKEDMAREELLAAVRREGFRARTFEEAWGLILGVQAEIALDASMGSKATSAAKFLREVYGEHGDEAKSDDGGLGIAGVEATRRLLELIEEEKARRGETLGE